jgi:nicotinamide-nucleotide amidase
MARVTPLRRAMIVAVGSELLTPLRVDTNSLWITEQLNAIGIDVVCKAVVGDDRDELGRMVRLGLERADLIVLTGGLGPTDDDVTREVVADVLGRPLAEDAAITGELRARFLRRGFTTPMPESNRRQAMVPAGAMVLENASGSAPGLWLDQDDRVVLLLPGPPRELRPMLARVIEERLRARAGDGTLLRRVVRVTGRIESQADEALRPLYASWQASAVPVAATILSHPGEIQLHLSVRAADRAKGDRALAEAVEQVVALFGADVFSVDGRTLEQVVGDLLAAQGLRIALAESCTGGLVTSRLTDVPGSSRYVERAVVTYANEAKVALLGVPPELIVEQGAVSEPVARAMAEGVRRLAAVEIGVGVTGIAGPSGGTPDKPVGSVAIAVAREGDTVARVFRFLGDRELIRFQASQAALDLTRRLVHGRG